MGHSCTCLWYRNPLSVEPVDAHRLLRVPGVGLIMDTLEYRDKLRDKMLDLEERLRVLKYVWHKLPVVAGPMDLNEVKRWAKEARGKDERQRSGVRA